MIAVLRYKEGTFTNDGSILFYVVSKHNAEVIKTTSFLCGGRPKVTIKVGQFTRGIERYCEGNKQRKCIYSFCC